MKPQLARRSADRIFCMIGFLGSTEGISKRQAMEAEIQRLADRAMYHAKAAGGDCLGSADGIIQPDPGA